MFVVCPLHHLLSLQQATYSALGGVGTGRMKTTSGSHMTLQLMDMQPAPPTASVLRENFWQVGVKYPYLPSNNNWFSVCGSFLVFCSGGITKWSSTQDSKDTERYPHYKAKENQQWFPQHQETPLFPNRTVWSMNDSNDFSGSARVVVVYQYTRKKFAKLPQNTQNSSKYTQNYTQVYFIPEIQRKWYTEYPYLSCNIPYTRFKKPLYTVYPKTLADPDFFHLSCGEQM